MVNFKHLDFYIKKARKALGEKNPLVRASYVIAPYTSKNQVTLVSDAAKSALKKGGPDDVDAYGLGEKLKNEFEAEVSMGQDACTVGIQNYLLALPFDVRSKFPNGIVFLANASFMYERLEGFPELRYIVLAENSYAQIMEIALHREKLLACTDIITLDFLTKTAGIKLKDENITKAWETELGKRWFEAAKKLGFEPSDNRADSRVAPA